MPIWEREIRDGIGEGRSYFQEEILKERAGMGPRVHMGVVFDTKQVMSSFTSGGRAREETAHAGNWLGVSCRSCRLIVFIEEVAEVAGSGWTWGFEERWDIGERRPDTAREEGRHCWLLTGDRQGLSIGSKWL